MSAHDDSHRPTSSVSEDAPAATRWDPGQYLAFADHRLRPALDLIARIPLAAPRLVVDLGCGTGNVTRRLAERWPAARVVGIDHSADMLREARATPSPVTWIEADLARWTPDVAPDLLFSNAALHWVEDHRALVPRLAGAVAAGGCFALQVPLSHDAPSHQLMREALAGGGPGGAPLGSEALRHALARRDVEDAATYYDLLAGVARRVDVWETEYLHVLEGEDPVLEWVRGTGMRPVVHALDDAARARFIDAYRPRLRRAYPPRPDGTTLYPFRRLFVVAER